jgi:hypothetical protein
VDNDTEMQLVWLLPDIRRKTAHVYYDYIKSPSGQPFLSGRSSCGANRDERLRIPADELGDRKCKSCLRNVERNARRDRERAEVFEKYGIPEGSR